MASTCLLITAIRRASSCPRCQVYTTPNGCGPSNSDSPDMRALIARFTAFYGSNPLHLLGTIATFALAGYVVTLLGPQALWNPKVWWQSIAVWFLAAIIAHDLILFPLYALADRSVTAALAVVWVRPAGPSAGVPRGSPLNYLRVP